MRRARVEGDGDWAPASFNTPLAAGDELYAVEGANLEIQIGARAYLRAGEETQLALTTVEPDFLQFRVTEGHVSLDLRAVKASPQTASFASVRSGAIRGPRRPRRPRPAGRPRAAPAGRKARQDAAETQGWR